MVSAQEIRVVAELLQISPEGLQKAITYKVTVRIEGGKPCYLLTTSIYLSACYPPVCLSIYLCVYLSLSSSFSAGDNEGEDLHAADC